MIVVAALRAGSTVQGLLLFLGYAAGMGLVIGGDRARRGAAARRPAHRLRRAAAWAPRVSGALLALAGAYVAYYGWYELRLAAAGRAAAGDPVVGAAVGAQQRLGRRRRPARAGHARRAVRAAAGRRRRRGAATGPGPLISVCRRRRLARLVDLGGEGGSGEA